MPAFDIQPRQAAIGLLLEKEKNINPFLRSHELSVKRAAESFSSSRLDDDAAVFAAVRRYKDEF